MTPGALANVFSLVRGPGPADERRRMMGERPDLDARREALRILDEFRLKMRALPERDEPFPGNHARYCDTIDWLVKRLRELDDRTCSTCKHWRSRMSEPKYAGLVPDRGGCLRGVQTLGENTTADFSCKHHESQEAMECTQK